MYRLVAEDYEKVFKRIARNAILEVASTYKAPDYWSKRTEIGIKMRQDLTAALSKSYARVKGFQLLKIDLPNPYEDAIVQTQVTNQQRLTMGEERKVNMTIQMTNNIVEAAKARIKIINS